jgi:hypothetical protein
MFSILSLEQCFYARASITKPLAYDSTMGRLCVFPEEMALKV